MSVFVQRHSVQAHQAAMAESRDAKFLWQALKAGPDASVLHAQRERELLSPG